MSEKNLRKNIRAKARKMKACIDWFSIENKATKKIPDQHFINQYGVAGWVELKVVKTANCKVKFENGQARFANKYWNRGGFSFIVVRVGRDVLIFAGNQSLQLESHKISLVPPLMTYTNDPYQRTVHFFSELGGENNIPTWAR